MHSRSNMRRCLTVLVALAGMSISGVVVAQESPYSEMTAREVKSLSSEQTRGYLEGGGMGMALPGELNGYPGPKHVLELRQELGLSIGQLAQVESFFDSMQQKAVQLGREIVEREAGLDALFASGEIDEASLSRLTEEIGRLNGRLRGVHLRAHLETAAALSPNQRQRYSQLRGYGEGHSTGHEGHH